MVEVHVVPALTDNYIHILHDAAHGITAVVDPGEAGPVRAFLAERGWRLTHILATHHHGDHIGGITDLRADSHAMLIGPRAEIDRIPEMDATYGEGDSFALGSQTVRVFDTPGHTRGHCAFFCEQARLLFSGDTLFSLGCGRLFEGTAAQMWDSLTKLRALPPETLIYCGHEYTASNARFALSIDPDNLALKARAEQVTALRAKGLPTIPARLSDEVAANPFLRADDPGLAAHVGLTDAPHARIFAAIRRAKDEFRG
ncbi:hydroxyacylglutathione hydrolase [Niveispirillum lacus]|uniref:Hydroxyacylglutathione hydrolase n=1 Tax=Niveispirillum lacus TaxID=1981099 RepID=A0A255Z0K0_9PROT|nr:hydroxyacylglutathione hydrolase [Niveispirillum lacus]OYQ34939.1 hydroxyacylglutathione hydrolase [Niveispirillum lacus]